MKLIKKLSFLVWTSMLMSACALHEAPALQRVGPTTLEIYSDHMHRADSLAVEDIHFDKETVRDEVFLEVRDESQHFPKFLRNLTLHMYVYPHLATSDQVPIPGYWTVFQLYSQNHYALPGER